MLPARLARHWGEPLYRNGYYLILNSVTGAASGFLFWWIVARGFSESDLGAAAALVSALTLAALLGKSGLDAALVRYGPRADSRARRRLLASALAVSVALAASVATLLVAGRGVLGAGLPPMGFAETSLFVAFAAATAAGWMFDAYFLAERRAGFSFARNSIYNGVRVALALAAATFAAPFGVVVAWGAAVFASVAASALLAVPLLRARRAGAAMPPRRALLRTAGANYFVNVGEWLPGLALPLLVFATLGAAASGRFYIAWTLAAIGLLASKAIAASAFAEMSLAAEPSTTLRRAVVQHALVLVPFVAAGFAFGPQILATFGEGYALASRVFALLLLALPFAAVVNLRMAVLRAQDAHVELVLLPLAVLVATFASSPYLLHAYGLPGVAFAWLGANAAGASWSLARHVRGGGFPLAASSRSVSPPAE